MLHDRFSPSLLLLWLALWATALSAMAQDAAPPGTRTLPSKHGFDTLVTRVEKAVGEQKLGLVAQASASLSRRTPGAVFAPYKNAAIDEMAREIDPVFERIARDAVGP